MLRTAGGSVFLSTRAVSSVASSLPNFSRGFPRRSPCRLPSQAALLGQLGSHLGIVRRYDRIFTRQIPLQPVVGRCELVIACEVPLQH